MHNETYFIGLRIAAKGGKMRKYRQNVNDHLLSKCTVFAGPN